MTIEIVNFPTNIANRAWRDGIHASIHEGWKVARTDRIVLDVDALLKRQETQMAMATVIALAMTIYCSQSPKIGKDD